MGARDGSVLPPDAEGGDTGVEGEETVGGGGVAPGDMVSGMRPPLPIEPGGSCASTGVVTITAARARMKVVRMPCIWWDRRRPQGHPSV